MLIISLFISFNLLAQPTCENPGNSSVPPTPYQNGYLRFDGRGDFLRTNDLNELEFDTISTNGFVIKTRIKIRRPFTPQNIFGKCYSAGWIFGYHTFDNGYIRILIGNSWKNIYYLGSDTAWHSYEIRYDKQARTLAAYIDNSLTYTYQDFSYGNLSNDRAFSVGNVGFLPQYGNQTVNLNSSWFKGDIDYLKISVNNENAVNYDFNECAGQVARDSASYYIFDRLYPGETYCGSAHFMLGYMPSKDTCDPEWIKEETNSLESRFSALGTGLQNWHSGEDGDYFTEHFSLCMTVWNGYLVNGGVFNIAGGNNARNIAKWDGASWSNIGAGLNHEPQGMTTYQNELYATGFFDSAGSTEARYIAKWNGLNWSPLSEGLNNIGNVMTVYNGELIVGGWFTSAGGMYSPGIARWDGSEWHNLGAGINGCVSALCVYNGELYAGGGFMYAGTLPCNGIARWDGSSWHTVGTGMAGGEYMLKTLEVYNG
jgi:hypothetical protein